MNNINDALEYSRRCRKGLPTDRFANGADGERNVAAGIDQMHWLLTWSYQEIERLKSEKVQSGMQAMEATPDPMR